MNETTLAALLGRSLTPIETTNWKQYLKIARESLDDLLCTNLCDDSVTRYFTGWDGYSTVWTDIFTDVEEVKINDSVVTNYTVRQGDRRTGNWYNSIVFDTRFTCDEEVEITADWGFQSMPSDLQLVLANLFGLITKNNTFDATVAKKKVEDFEIWLNVEADLNEEFYKTFGRTIQKYSLCNKMGIIQGKTKC